MRQYLINHRANGAIQEQWLSAIIFYMDSLWTEITYVSFTCVNRYVASEYICIIQIYNYCNMLLI